VSVFIAEMTRMNRKCSSPSWFTVFSYQKYINKNFGEEVSQHPAC